MGLAGAPLVYSESSFADDASPEALAPTARMELFNGKDFSGWTFFMRTNADPAKTWRVEDGVIKCSGQPFGYVRTEKDYRDYKLTVEWRFTKSGNTGVLIHARGEDKLWPTSLECQGQAGNHGDFIAFEGVTFKEREAAGGRRVPKQGPSAEKPTGEWNTYEIVCAGDTVKCYVNGKLMNQATGCNLTFGKIAIQSEGSEFEIRKVTLEPAKAE